jgi:hypothetical protein
MTYTTTAGATITVTKTPNLLPAKFPLHKLSK